MSVKARKIWRSKEWRDKRKEFIKDKSCISCGSLKHLSIHHPQKKNSLSEKEYLSFKGVKILCKRCHYASLNGLVICPECKQKYTKYDLCWKCGNERAIKEKEIEKEIEKLKKDIIIYEFDSDGESPHCPVCSKKLKDSDDNFWCSDKCAEIYNKMGDLYRSN